MKEFKNYLVIVFFCSLMLSGCGARLAQPEPFGLAEPTAAAVGPSSTALSVENAADATPTDSPNEVSIPLVERNSAAALADVLSVQASGNPQAYQFSVEISSPDLGCEQYANWWELVSEDGELLYRRILAHSHVSEQPFSRSGGPVPIEADQVVWVRAHMDPGGYGGIAFKGSVETGFEATSLDSQFGLELGTTAPLPSGCAW